MVRPMTMNIIAQRMHLHETRHLKSCLYDIVSVLHKPNLPLATPFPQLEQPILPPFSQPSLDPHPHLLPASRTPHIDSRHNLFNPQRTTKHGQLSKTRVLRVRHPEAAGTAGAAPLWHEFLHGERAAPVGTVQDGLHGGAFDEARVRGAVLPP